MTKTVDESVEAFNDKVSQVHQLMDFDQEIIQLAISGLERCEKWFVKQGITNTYVRPTKQLRALKAIRDHESVTKKYSTMHNQCLVLLVSHFESSLEDLFRCSLIIALKSGSCKCDAKTEIPLQLRKVAESGFDLNEHICDAIINNSKTSFQAMQSTHRTFTTYLGCEMATDADVNNIIVGQGIRHALVHGGGKVDDRLLNQVRKAFPRTVLESMTLGERIQLVPEHIRTIGVSMSAYFSTLSKQLCVIFENSSDDVAENGGKETE